MSPTSTVSVWSSSLLLSNGDSTATSFSTSTIYFCPESVVGGIVFDADADADLDGVASASCSFTACSALWCSSLLPCSSLPFISGASRMMFSILNLHALLGMTQKWSEMASPRFMAKHLVHFFDGPYFCAGPGVIVTRLGCGPPQRVSG